MACSTITSSRTRAGRAARARTRRIWRHLRGPGQGHTQELVRLGRDLPGRLEVVALADADRIDGLQWDERFDLDCLGRRQRQVSQFVLADGDDLFFGQLVALADLVGADLAVLDLAELPDPYPAHVLWGFRDRGVTSYGTSSLR
jgi:hypothetical protein